MPTIPYKEGGDFPELPTRTPLLVEVIESNYVTEANPFYGKATGRKDKVTGADIIDLREERDVVKTVMEVIQGDFTGSRIWANFTASVNEKSKLLPFLQAVNDHELTREELEAFDTDDLKGMKVWVSGSFKPGDEAKKFLRPDSFMRVQPGDIKPVSKPAKKATAKPPVKTLTGRDAALAALKAKQAAELAALDGDVEVPTTTQDDDATDEFDPDEIPF
jgi:hypothetical protein